MIDSASVDSGFCWQVQIIEYLYQMPKNKNHNFVKAILIKKEGGIFGIL